MLGMRFIFLLILGVGIGFPANAATLTLNPQARIDRAAILLTDVFAGLDPAQDVEIAVAPAPGRSVTYDYTVLTKLARHYSLDWRTAGFSDKTVITRAGNKIDQAMIKSSVSEQLRALGVQGDLDVALDNRALEIDLPSDIKPDFALSDFNYDKSNQRFRAELLAAADTPAFRQVTVTGRAVNAVPVPVLNRVLPQGAVIGKADLDWIKMPADRANDYLRTAESIAGMELRHQMAERSPLRVQDVAPARVILRGSLVAMKISTPSMQITAQGRALQDGAVGDVIRVTNTQSNRTIDAKVLAGGEVGVESPIKFASTE